MTKIHLVQSVTATAGYGNNSWNAHLYDDEFACETFFIPAGTNRLSASLMGSSSLKRGARNARKIGLDSEQIVVIRN